LLQNNRTNIIFQNIRDHIERGDSTYQLV